MPLSLGVAISNDVQNANPHMITLIQQSSILPARRMERTGTLLPFSEKAPQPEHDTDAGGFTLRDECQPEAAFASPALDRFAQLYRSKQRRRCVDSGSAL